MQVSSKDVEVLRTLAHQYMEALPESVRECARPVLTASSAGLYADFGDPISSNAVLALEAAQVKPVPFADYHQHTAHTITEEEAESFDLLIAMSDGHAMELLLRFPQAAHKICCMPTPISDPYGGDLARYQVCLEEITDGVRALLFAEALT